MQRILASSSIELKLNELFLRSSTHDVPLYVLIDGYDYLADSVLADRGTSASRWLSPDFASFYRSFFATLKAGTGHGGIERILVAGVTPISMTGVTGGFNIGTDISLHPEFNEMLGFTEAEVRDLLERYRRLGVFDQDVNEAMAVMGEWYGGYRFAERARNDLYHTKSVLRYLMESISNGGPPDDLIDDSVRVHYGKLRHLLTVNRQLNETFDMLRQLACESAVESPVRDGFLLEELAQPENLPSLLHYFGLLSIQAEREYIPRLGIPTRRCVACSARVGAGSQIRVPQPEMPGTEHGDARSVTAGVGKVPSRRRNDDGGSPGRVHGAGRVQHGVQIGDPGGGLGARQRRYQGA